MAEEDINTEVCDSCGDIVKDEDRPVTCECGDFYPEVRDYVRK
jgi:hypothetical protein